LPGQTNEPLQLGGTNSADFLFENVSLEPVRPPLERTSSKDAPASQP